MIGKAIEFKEANYSSSFNRHRIQKTCLKCLMIQEEHQFWYLFLNKMHLFRTQNPVGILHKFPPFIIQTKIGTKIKGQHIKKKMIFVLYLCLNN